MNLLPVLSICMGASMGALLRWWLGSTLNPVFPMIPLGTLVANVVGGFLMGLFMGVTKNHLFIPEGMRLAIATGFLGGLTTFSTFSGETVTLLANQEYFMSLLIVTAHVGGSIASTIFGIYTVKLCIS